MKILRSLIFSILITFFIILPVCAADSNYEFSNKSVTLYKPGYGGMLGTLQAKDGEAKLPEDLKYFVKKAGDSSNIELPTSSYNQDLSKTYGFFWMGMTDWPNLLCDSDYLNIGNYIVTATYTDNGKTVNLEIPVEVKTSSVTGMGDVKFDNTSIVKNDPSDYFDEKAPVFDASKQQTYQINYDIEPKTAEPDTLTYVLEGDYGYENWASIDQETGIVTLKSSTPRNAKLYVYVKADGFTKGGRIKITGLPVVPPNDVDKLKHVYFAREKGPALPMTYTVKDSDKNGVYWGHVTAESNSYPGANYKADMINTYSTEYLLESGALVFTSEKGTVKYDKDTEKLTFTGKPGDKDKLYLMCGNNSSLSTPQDPEGKFGYIEITYLNPGEAYEGRTLPIFRLYNSVNHEHLYTPDANEKSLLSAQSAWTYEGIGWKAPETGEPVYRLYSPETGNHLYTTDENEKNVLVNERGWSADNNGAPLFYSGGSVPIYRVYHEGLKQHHLTTDVNEYNVLGSQGWNQEGVKLKAASLN